MTNDAHRSGDDAATADLSASPPPYAPAAAGYGAPAPAVPPPASAPPRRDRIWIHFAWEGVLLALLLVGVGLWWLFGGDMNLLAHPDVLVDRMYISTPYLLMATALALSLRVRAVNLAIGAIAGLSAVLVYEWSPEGGLTAVGIALGAALVAGAVLALLTAGLKLPGWAASLGVVAAVPIVAQTIVGEDGYLFFGNVGSLVSGVLMSEGVSDGEATSLSVGQGAATLIVLAAIAVSVLGGALGMLPPVRRLLGGCRDAAAESDRRGAGPGLATSAALLVSSLLAGAAGILLVTPSESDFGIGSYAAGILSEPMGIGLAFAIVLLGGTSLWGKRGGVFGTFFAALILFTVHIAFDELGWWYNAPWIVVGAIAAGFAVSWLFELLGTVKPKPTPPPAPIVAPFAPPPGPAFGPIFEPAPPAPVAAPSEDPTE
ncbi:MAG: hypothetical protein ACRDXX_18405, partial [Stackebrandtia sp.]